MLSEFLTSTVTFVFSILIRGSAWLVTVFQVLLFFLFSCLQRSHRSSDCLGGAWSNGGSFESNTLFSITAFHSNRFGWLCLSALSISSGVLERFWDGTIPNWRFVSSEWLSSIGCAFSMAFGFSFFLRAGQDPSVSFLLVWFV
jgi:hypothetical protein